MAAVCGTAKNTTSHCAKSVLAWVEKANSVTPQNAGYASASGVPSSASDVAATSSNSGWARRMRHSSIPANPAAPTTPALMDIFETSIPRRKGPTRKRSANQGERQREICAIAEINRGRNPHDGPMEKTWRRSQAIAHRASSQTRCKRQSLCHMYAAQVHS